MNNNRIRLNDKQKILPGTRPRQYFALELGDACNIVLNYILSRAENVTTMLTNKS